MAKIVIITGALIAAGAEEIKKAILADPENAASDIIVIAESAKDAEKVSDDLLRKYNTALQTITTLQAEKQDLATINQELVAEIENAGKTILMESADGKPGGFEYDGKKYRFNFHTMQFGKEVITSEKIVADTELQAELIATGSCMVSEIE